MSKESKPSDPTPFQVPGSFSIMFGVVLYMIGFLTGLVVML